MITSRWQALRLGVVAGCMGLGALTHASPGFYLISPVGGFLHSRTESNLSLDATAAAGEATTDFDQWGGLRWTEGGGSEDLGHLSGGSDSKTVGWGISGDGGTVVGYASGSAAYWRPGTGLVSIGLLNGSSRATALRCSMDGSIVVGESYPSGFRWTQETGMVALPSLPGDVRTSATDITPDGAMICGASISVDGNATGVIWTTGGIRELPFLPDSTGTQPNAISADGTTVVGEATYASGPGPTAFVWHDGVMENIGTARSWARGVSSNGKYVVGIQDGTGGFIWSAEHGLRSTYADMLMAGLDVPQNWSWGETTGVQVDENGEVSVLGQGQGPDGKQRMFLARYTPNAVPEPGSIVAVAGALAALRIRRRRR